MTGIRIRIYKLETCLWCKIYTEIKIQMKYFKNIKPTLPDWFQLVILDILEQPLTDQFIKSIAWKRSKMYGSSDRNCDWSTGYSFGVSINISDVKLMTTRSTWIWSIVRQDSRKEEMVPVGELGHIKRQYQKIN